MIEMKVADHPLAFLMGGCFIITDKETGKTVEVMAMQLRGIIGEVKGSGSLPHGGWERDGEQVVIYHDEDRDKHEVSFTLKEMEEAMNVLEAK